MVDLALKKQFPVFLSVYEDTDGWKKRTVIFRRQYKTFCIVLLKLSSFFKQLLLLLLLLLLLFVCLMLLFVCLMLLFVCLFDVVVLFCLIKISGFLFCFPVFVCLFF